MNYWLMKCEPDVFSIDDLARQKVEGWYGIRNYQARNMMRDAMRIGDQVFFYHSNVKVPGIVGLMEVISKPYPDPTQFDPDHRYFDPKATPEQPRWVQVDVQYIRHTRRLISLEELKKDDSLGELPLLRRGNRLSIMPVGKSDWQRILELEAAN
ncbi:EVE domain-containing protein [Halothiobacillus diazotrophicus]|uniref:EVE domain-containing protein n=1 Tax=Halothiobacillus diazotrophicus TaxID=1860122 RepID=A0A191ZFG4_9GAMM|nr:EVE domain-containing protein [Halothiobacillus diazotrophicus]ANJ66608.1 EVE domain-containing protein [Halothiobacillus diazotrophicus]